MELKVGAHRVRRCDTIGRCLDRCGQLVSVLVVCFAFLSTTERIQALCFPNMREQGEENMIGSLMDVLAH